MAMSSQPIGGPCLPPCMQSSSLTKLQKPPNFPRNVTYVKIQRGSGQNTKSLYNNPLVFVFLPKLREWPRIQPLSSQVLNPQLPLTSNSSTAQVPYRDAVVSWKIPKVELLGEERYIDSFESDCVTH